MTDHQIHEFRLRSGEKVTVRVSDEGPLGTPGGLRLHVTMGMGAMLVLPSAANSVVLMSERGLATERAEINNVVQQRDAP